MALLYNGARKKQYPKCEKNTLTFGGIKNEKEGTKMWLDNLKEIKAEKKMSTKQIADRAGLPEKNGHTCPFGENFVPLLGHT